MTSKAAAALCAVCGAFAMNSHAVSAAARAPLAAPAVVERLQVRNHIYLVSGALGNATVMATDEGVLVVDALDAASAPGLINSIRGISAQPILYLINTSARNWSVGGNDAFFKLGGSTLLFAAAGVRMDTASDAATIVAHENVGLQLSQTKTIPPEAWPEQTFFYGEKEIYFGDEAVRLIHVPNATTDGDILVYFRGSDVISTGDVFSMTNYPIIDRKHGGSVAGVIAALNLVLDIAIPGHAAEGGTLIIPGRGRICDEHDVLEYRDMLVIIRARVQDLIAKGMTLEQVKRARPALDYDPRFGAGLGDWNTDNFVAGLYEELKAAK